MLNDRANYAYFLGCFGDGNGLGIGTGYAVCEIMAKGRIYFGEWRRYKKIAEVQPCFTSNSSSPYDYDRFTVGCFVPDKASFDNMTVVDGHLDLICDMSAHGWDFGVDLPYCHCSHKKAVLHVPEESDDGKLHTCK